MTTKELRAYIDRTLGNSIRCLLPSYWWKRLFGAVVDKVEAVDTKVTGVSNRVNGISTKVNDLSEQVSGIDVSVANIVVVEWDHMESSTTANNKEAYTLIRHCLENNKPIAVVVWDTIQGLANPHYVAKSFNIRNELDGTVAVWIRFIYDSTENHSQYLAFKLTEDGTLKLNKEENIYDDSMSAISTNAVQNKVIKAYVDEQVAKAGGSIDTSNLVTKEELEANEAVYASAITDLNTRLAALEAQLTNN